MTDDTREHPGAFDAFSTAKPGEPIFTLQGGDPLAAPMVMFWAMLARIRALGVANRAETADVTAAMVAAATHVDRPAEQHELLLRASSAEEVAWKMVAYRKGQSLVSDQQAAYAQSLEHSTMDNAGSDDAVKKLLRHRLLNRSAEGLDNSVAEVASIAERLAEEDPDLARALTDLSEQLKVLSANVRPHR